MNLGIIWLLISIDLSDSCANENKIIHVIMEFKMFAHVFHLFLINQIIVT